MGLWDVAFKHLLRLRPHDLLDLVPGLRPDVPLRLLDKELTRVPAPKALDGCVELEGDPEGTLYHVEFEAAPRSDTGFRAFEHFALAHCAARGRPVRTVVFYVTPGAEGRAAAACYGVEADGRVVCDFRFEAVRLWEIDADELLRRPAPALWAVVALARGAELAHVGRAAAQVGHEVADEAMRRELLAVLYNVSGTRFEAGGLRALIPREVLMRSTTYDEIVQEGEERGLLKGRIQGELEGQVRALQRVCRRVAELKLSPLPASLAAIIEGLSEPAHLEALLLDLTAAADADAARAALARHAR